MRVRYQIHSALLLIIFISLACRIQMPENMARYATPTPPIETTAFPDAVTTNPALPLPAVPIVLIKPLPSPMVFVESQPADSVVLIGPKSTPAAAPAEPSLPSPLPDPGVSSLVKEITFADTTSVDAINQLQASFYPTNNELPAQFAVDRFKLRFKSRNELGHWVSIRAEVFVPRVVEPAEFPLFVYGAGTTGINNACAPLDEDAHGRNWGHYQTHMTSYAAQGFITVLPHWQGYDDYTRKHHYFIAELEASILIDATRAVYELFNQNQLPYNVLAHPAQAVFYGGYSQGGHGAFAALDAAPHYAPDLPIKGIVGHATAPSVEALLRERPSLAPYIVYTYLNYYGDSVINPEAVFLPNWLSTFYTDAASKCVDEAYKYYPADPNLLYRPEFLRALYSDQLAVEYPAFKAALETNYVGDSLETSVPVVLFHGEADTIVTSDTHEHFVARMCNRGKHVNYKLYPQVTHFQTRQYSFVDSIAWMRNVLNGQAPESQCSTFFTSQFE